MRFATLTAAVAAVCVTLLFAVDARPASGSEAPAQAKANAAHEALFARNRFPSATQCGECHPTEYRQWSVSQHAYAQMSPIFNAMSAEIRQAHGQHQRRLLHPLPFARGHESR